MASSENPQLSLAALIGAHQEWLVIDGAGRSFAVRSAELEVTFERGRTLFAFLDDKGFQTWRVESFKTKNSEILLNLTRNFEKERARLRLVPRALAGELSDAVELARLERAHQVAAILKENFAAVKIVRVELNKENGRFAQIVIENRRGSQTAVLSDVSESLTPEILLSSAILWLVKLQARRKNSVDAVWILGEQAPAKKLQKLHGLLRESWKSKILVKEICRRDAEAQSEVVMDLPPLTIADLRRGARTREMKIAAAAQLSETARQIAGTAPDQIDVVFSKHGETLRFNGLPFARVRRVFEREKIWFGVEKARQLLTPNNEAEFGELLENLRRFRRFDSPNKRHAFYESAPEAWLEAALRRNIKLLDANLMLSPVYHQFRAEREKIDLLALRRDGRLVIVELKTAPDREMLFQAADYWRKIERQRHAGNLRKARLFGDAEIADAPAICYLVAPTLSFHLTFDFLASTISPEIEMHRFNLAENWRENLKVLERRN